MEAESALSKPIASAESSGEANTAGAWGNVVLAAVLMLATLPGRTQGLGLITEPLLRDLQLDRVAYADLNLWATLIGSAACLPMGWLIDRAGLRWTTVAILLPLALVVYQMAALAPGGAELFALLLATRALGQSALSVSSITAVGKSFGQRSGWAMGVYSILLSIFFIIAFVVVGKVVSAQGWRVAWIQVAIGVAMVAALTAVALREPARAALQESAADGGGISLGSALRTPVFWIFAGGTALFGLVSSGLGLFNEAVLAERGFNQEAFLSFLGVTTLFALIGQMLCGWLSTRFSPTRLLAGALFVYGVGLAALPGLKTMNMLWVIAALLGLAAGFITVIFFAVWGQAYGRRQLGRIQGAAQMLTVFASAVGPLIFARSHAATGSYMSLLSLLAAFVFALGAIAWWLKFEPFAASHSSKS